MKMIASFIVEAFITQFIIERFCHIATNLCLWIMFINGLLGMDDMYKLNPPPHFISKNKFETCSSSSVDVVVDAAVVSIFIVVGFVGFQFILVDVCFFLSFAAKIIFIHKFQGSDAHFHLFTLILIFIERNTHICIQASK